MSLEPTTTTHVPTTNGSKYLQQICKHFGHKLPVEFTTNAGEIQLPFGKCRLEASESELILIGEAASDQIEHLEKIIENHLARFAFRETPEVSWQRS
ncbi:MAG: DUF2218 domain-containing protein [Hyphomicrobiales bacterium]|nr:DUF2218 domain-containing protein [Hyphomicrobiales bacterium]